MRHTTTLLMILAVLAGVGLVAASAATQPGAVEDDLSRARAEQREVQALIERCSPAFCSVGPGSGVCIRKDGLILTNDHVAGGRGEWAVFFGDGRPPLMARRLGADERGDICLLQVIGEHDDLPCLSLAETGGLEVGERVMALGNPWVLSQDGRPTVTFGVISGLHYNQGGYSNAIVTDTPVNPGNSGGPLISMRGEVIGINGRIMTRFQRLRFNTGVAFAIPGNQIRNFMKTIMGDELIWHGAVHDFTTYAASDPRGLGVNNIYKTGPSYAAGLRYDDVITKVNGVPITTPEQFSGLLAAYPAGVTVKLSVVRDKKPLTVAIPLASEEYPLTGIFLDVTSRKAPIDPVLVPRVARIVSGGPAERAGFRVGDRLTHLDGRPLQTGEQFVRWVRYHPPGRTLQIGVERGGRSLLLPLTLDGKPAEK